MIPKKITEDEEIGTNVEHSFCALLKEMRYENSQIKKKYWERKLDWKPGTVCSAKKFQDDDGSILSDIAIYIIRS